MVRILATFSLLPILMTFIERDWFCDQRRNRVPTYPASSAGIYQSAVRAAMIVVHPSSWSSNACWLNNRAPTNRMTSLNTASNPAFYGFQLGKYTLSTHKID